MTVDLSKVPLVALSVETKYVISTLLNPPKVIPCDNGLPRDWRGLAHLSELSGEIMPLLTSHPDPSAHILTVWEQKQKNITIKDLQGILEEIDRWDILDDTSPLIEKDAVKYLECLQRSQNSAEAIEDEIDAQVLTVDDLHRLRQGLENQYYDAFLLYADEDASFANEMIDKLENQYNLKLCTKNRDLLGGITFEHEAVMTLISERCNRLIVIVSSNFIKSPANKFFLNYAQALGIDKRQRKVIPCLYDNCQVPPQLTYMFILDYKRIGLYDFWGKLRDSVQTPNNIKHKLKSTMCKTQNELRSEKENHVDNVGATEKLTVQENDLKSLNAKEVQEEIAESKDYEGLKHLSSDSLQVSKDKKQNNFFQWTKKKLNLKTDRKESEPITETVTIASLPSLDGLDTLSISMESVNKKQKTSFINKCVKKVQLKKVLVKS